MFSPEIVSADKFLDMPISSQALYFHLGMFADDDGFVSPRKVMRMLGVQEDDLKILISKRYVIPFESGVIVIRHWKVNNLVRKDWYRPTIYQDEKGLITPDRGGVYYLVNEFVNEPVNIGSKEVSKEEKGKFLEKGKKKLLKKYRNTPKWRIPDDVK